MPLNKETETEIIVFLIYSNLCFLTFSFESNLLFQSFLFPILFDAKYQWKDFPLQHSSCNPSSRLFVVRRYISAWRYPNLCLCTLRVSHPSNQLTILVARVHLASGRTWKSLWHRSERQEARGCPVERLVMHACLPSLKRFVMKRVCLDEWFKEN